MSSLELVLALGTDAKVGQLHLPVVRQQDVDRLDALRQ